MPTQIATTALGLAPQFTVGTVHEPFALVKSVPLLTLGLTPARRMGPCCRFGSWSACSCTACPGLRDDFSDPVDTWPKAVETLTATAARIAKYFDTIVSPCF